MIISASYRTDIPAFYSQWLKNRINKGFATVKNPYNNKTHQVSLKPKDTSAYVFWTRNANPIKPTLAHLNSQKIPFYISWTITAYPRLIEPAIPNQNQIIQSLNEIAKLYGKDSITWRYDPIIISSITPINFHIQNFTKLCQKLKGYTNEVITSFCHYYQKSNRQLAQIKIKNPDFKYYDPTIQEKCELLEKLQNIANEHSMKLTLCTQPQLTNHNLIASRCIDTERLSRISNKPIQAPINANRKGCLCAKAQDIGRYDTCPHGCRYCYANHSQNIAKRNFKLHQQNQSQL